MFTTLFCQVNHCVLSKKTDEDEEKERQGYPIYPVLVLLQVVFPLTTQMIRVHFNQIEIHDLIRIDFYSPDQKVGCKTDLGVPSEQNVSIYECTDVRQTPEDSHVGVI